MSTYDKELAGLIDYQNSSGHFDTTSIGHAFATCSASTVDGWLTDRTGGTLVEQSGKSLVVINVLAIAGGTATNLTFNTKPTGAGTSGTAITSPKACAANGGFMLPTNKHGWFETDSGAALTFSTGAGSAIGLDISYFWKD